GRAREGGLRERAIRQGLRLQRRALLASAKGRAGDRSAASRPRWRGLSLLGCSPHAARPSSRRGGPAEREDPACQVLGEPSASQGPAPGSRGLRGRAALVGALYGQRVMWTAVFRPSVERTRLSAIDRSQPVWLALLTISNAVAAPTTIATSGIG